MHFYEETVACYIYLSGRKTFRTKDKALSEVHSILSHYGFLHIYIKGSESPLNCYDMHTFQNVIFSALSSDTRST